MAIKYARAAVSLAAVAGCQELGPSSTIGSKLLHYSCLIAGGIYNIEADGLSRHAWAEVEWKLNPHLLRRIQGIWKCAFMHIPQFF
jgi:hypothetical protein